MRAIRGWLLIFLLILLISAVLPIFENSLRAAEPPAPSAQFVILEDTERWRPALYQKKDFHAIEQEVDRLLQKVPDELASGYLSRMYDSLSEIPEGAVVEQMKNIIQEWCTASPKSHIPWLVKGKFLIHYAWKIRTDGWAKDVPKEAWPLFRENLGFAQKTLEKSWEINPKDPNSSTALITVSMGLSLDKSKMERYYQNALAVDPSHLGARMAKVFYLEPKWLGSLEEMYAFARTCQKEAAQFPFAGCILVEAHYENDKILYRADKKSDFLGSENVWKEVREVYENILRKYPDYLRARFYYAYFAYLARQNKIAAEQFDILGNRWAPNTAWDDTDEYNKGRVRVYTALANEGLKDKNYADAERMFLKVVDIDPKDGDAYLNLSWINGEIKHDMRKTTEYAQKALTCELNSSQETSARSYIEMAKRISGSS